MEAGGPRSQGLGGLPGSMPEGELITEKTSAPEHRARQRAWERRVSPGGQGSARLRGSAGAVHPNAGGLGAGGATPQEGLPRAPNPWQTLTPPLPHTTMLLLILWGVQSLSANSWEY